MNALPWTYEPRPDTRTSTVRLGLWLFLASEAMFFGSLFSAYVLLRTGAASWPDSASLGGLGGLLMPTLMLVLATRAVRTQPLFTVVFGVIFLLTKALEFARVLESGQHPAANLLLACWFVLTGLHCLHVAGGVAAGVWMMRSESAARAEDAARTALQRSERLHALWLYWCFIDVVWAAILVSFYFI